MTAVFVNSRGRRADEEYEWHELTPDGDVPVDGWAPSAYLERGLDRLGWGDVESYVLLRSRRQLVLMITAIRSRLRSDFIARTVHDSLLLTAGADEESAIRGLAALAIEDVAAVGAILDRAIRFDDRTGFSVDSDTFAPLLAAPAPGTAPPDPRRCVVSFDEHARAWLARQLRDRRLPRGDGWLIAASPVADADTLRELAVWRGLAGIRGENEPVLIGSMASPARLRTRPRLRDLVEGAVVLGDGLRRR